jgi:peptide/nickel transport system ATP-binding protein
VSAADPSLVDPGLAAPAARANAEAVWPPEVWRAPPRPVTAPRGKLDPRDRGGPAQPLLTVAGLVKHFHVGGSPLGGSTVVRALDGVDFEVLKGETLGIVGESGCGKSTTARLLMQLMRPDAGTILFDGEELGGDLALRDYLRQVQMVFQDSYASLNPRLTVEASIGFGPRVHGLSAQAATARAHDLLARVGLEPARFAGRFPHELSGGQRQRVNIARALAMEPRLVILDEAVSALDKSVEAQVLNLLMDLKQEFGLTYIFISHDLNVVRFMVDRVLVMYLGKVAEIGGRDAVFDAPRHPYTAALIASMPSMDPSRRVTEAPLSGDPPNPIDPPPGCRFHPRCAFAEPVCAKVEPPMAPASPGHGAACLMAEPGSGHSRAPARSEAVPA